MRLPLSMEAVATSRDEGLGPERRDARKAGRLADGLVPLTPACRLSMHGGVSRHVDAPVRDGLCDSLHASRHSRRRAA